MARHHTPVPLVRCQKPRRKPFCSAPRAGIRRARRCRSPPASTSIAAKDAGRRSSRSRATVACSAPTRTRLAHLGRSRRDEPALRAGCPGRWSRPSLQKIEALRHAARVLPRRSGVKRLAAASARCDADREGQGPGCCSEARGDIPHELGPLGARCAAHAAPFRRGCRMSRERWRNRHRAPPDER